MSASKKRERQRQDRLFRRVKKETKAPRNKSVVVKVPALGLRSRPH